jgi:hypothetical protein
VPRGHPQPPVAPRFASSSTARRGVTMRITTFAGTYCWLSNFHPSTVQLDRVEYPTVEHAYQAPRPSTTRIADELARPIGLLAPVAWVEPSLSATIGEPHGSPSWKAFSGRNSHRVANVITAILVLFASRVGLPVSTTHVASGSLFGLGAVTEQAQWRTIAHIILAWVVTLPCAAACAALTWWPSQLRSCRRITLDSSWATACQVPLVSSTTLTPTSMPRNEEAGPMNVPHSGSALRGSHATATRIKLRLPTMLLVGSKSIQPAPGK